MFPVSFVLFTAFTAVLGAPSKFRPQARTAPSVLTALTTADLNALDSFTQFARVSSSPQLSNPYVQLAAQTFRLLTVNICL
jgi:hypothetical protein